MTLKSGFFLSIFLLFGNNTYSQSLDQNLKLAATEIAQKITKKNKGKIAVADFVNNAGKSDALTRYVTEQLEMGLINSDGDIQIIDRKHIQQLLSDNHLQSEGLIDEATAKSSVGFIKVDGWAIGQITSFGDQIKISVKVIDVSTSLIYAAYMTEMINDAAIKKFTSSTEEQSEPVNKECALKGTGDFCFANDGSYAKSVSSSVEVTLVGSDSKYHAISVMPDENGCFYDLPIGVYDYYLLFSKPNLTMFTHIWNPIYHYKGQIKIEKCKSGLFHIN